MSLSLFRGLVAEAVPRVEALSMEVYRSGVVGVVACRAEQLRARKALAGRGSVRRRSVVLVPFC